jgi:hypothetical protein
MMIDLATAGENKRGKVMKVLAKLTVAWTQSEPRRGSGWARRRRARVQYGCALTPYREVVLTVSKLRRFAATYSVLLRIGLCLFSHVRVEGFEFGNVQSRVQKNLSFHLVRPCSRHVLP